MEKQVVSVIVDREVIPSKKEEFEENLKGIIKESEKFPGYIDTHVVYPEGDNRYKVLFRFDSEENLEKWVGSEERAYWVEKIDQLLVKPIELQVITGLETWFAIPGHKTITPPPRYKMAIVTWLAITPLLIAFNYLFGPYLIQLPLVLRFVVSTPFIVLIMTYLLMPSLTKLFRRWLYP